MNERAVELVVNWTYSVSLEKYNLSIKLNFNMKETLL